ncbi:MAG: HAD-IC family P-type ATPase, partial [Cellulomonadaceae bacterium]|nr:HAD-IC family P-type ATPase [Cellulomonadaceae bacterium]
MPAPRQDPAGPGRTTATPVDARPHPLPDDPSMLGARQVAELLGTDLDTGLSATEADRRLRLHGPNTLVSAPPVPAWRRLLAQLREPLVVLLLVAVVISFTAWLVEGRDGAPFDAVVILVIVIANAVLGYVQERRAQDAVAALQAMSAPTAAVVRDGEVQRVPTRDVVVGDVLALAEGDAVPADARLAATAALGVAEASLTGESEPVDKEPAALDAPAALGDRTGMVFGGTSVTRGTGRAVVV